MNALILPTKGNNYRPPVASYVVKTSKNAKRGTRIISLSSLLAHIRAGSNSGEKMPITPVQESASSNPQTGEGHAPRVEPETSAPKPLVFGALAQAYVQPNSPEAPMPSGRSTV
jgi:hypothetical protein